MKSTEGQITEMNNTQPRPLNYTFIFLSLIIGGSIAVVLISAIAGEQLGDVVSAIAVVGMIFVALGIIVAAIMKLAADPIAKIGNIKLEHQREANRHDERYLEKGYIRNGSGYILMTPQIMPPVDKPANPGSQIIFNPNALRESSVNLLLFSMRLLGEDSNRIASGPECAAANITGYTGRTWDKMINGYLKQRFPDIATIQGPIQNGGGVYIPESVGTVKNMYQLLMRDSAVDALPGVTR